MARPRSPFSPRSRNVSFTGAEVQAAAVKLAKSKKARVVRKAEDFDAAKLRAFMRAPISSSGGGVWTIEQIMGARAAQMAGNFGPAYRLAKELGTDGSLFTARLIRLAPVQSLSVKIEPGKGPKAEKIKEEAEALFGDHGIAISSATMTSIRQALVDHGVAFGVINSSPRDDGSRVDMTMSAWPMAWVRWDSTRACYVTQVQELDEEPEPGARTFAAGITHPEEPIVHGEGRWVVFAKNELEPHCYDAAILPAAMIWPRRAFAMRDWSKGSAVDGNAKVVGELPEGDALTDAEGNPTAEAAAFMTLLEAIASQSSPYGIKPHGSTVEILSNAAGAWEVFAKLTEVAERDAAKIYLGTDGVLGAKGGAPGVDISALMGVASSKIQSDLQCIEAAIQSGLIAFWCAVNFGDSAAAPTRTYVFPDPDKSEFHADFAKRNAAFNADVTAYRANGFVVDQTLVDRLADLHGVPAPMLPVVEAAPLDPIAPAAAA